MFSPCTFLLVSLTFWTHRPVTGNCQDKPVFTPPSLVVRYGDPASASCSACKTDCLDKVFDLEKAVGTTTKNGTNILWEIASLTEWGTSLMCFYNDNDGNQCFTNLPITLYQPPEAVSIRFLHGDGPLLAGQLYVLECAVQKVAPLKNLIVTFYKGSEVVVRMFSDSSVEQEPVDTNFTHNIRATEEDDGAQYWCQAQLNVKAETEISPTSSQKLHPPVHYKPRLLSPSLPVPIAVTVTERRPLELSCSAVGNPPPSYAWTGPADAGHLPSSSIYRRESVTFSDGGQYKCTVSNSMGTVVVTFNVDVQDDYLEVMIGVPVAVLALIAIVFLVVYFFCYKPKRKGSYNLYNFFFQKVASSA